MKCYADEPEHEKKSATDPGFFFQRQIGMERVKYTRQLKLVWDQRRADFTQQVLIQMKYYADDPEHVKYLWPGSLFQKLDRNRVCSVYPVTKNRFETGGRQVLHNKFWSRWNIMQMTPNMKNTSDPDLFFKSWIGIEYVQYTQ